MVLVYLPSDALLQHLPSPLCFSYLARGLSLHGCSSKAQPLLLTLDEVTPPDLESGVAPLSPPAPTQPSLLGRGIAPLLYICTKSSLFKPLSSAVMNIEVHLSFQTMFFSGYMLRSGIAGLYCRLYGGSI